MHPVVSSLLEGREISQRKLIHCVNFLKIDSFPAIVMTTHLSFFRRHMILSISLIIFIKS